MAKEATKAPAKKAAPKKDYTQILAYNVRAKEKQPIVDPVIGKTPRGGYMASGLSEDGAKLTTILSEADAKIYIENKVATKDKKTWK